MNIYLIGMPGCGKSSVGKFLSNLINYQYIDLDNYIETSNNTTIPLIFQEFGEEKFRELERKALNEIKELDNTIISCGGGIICNANNKKLMNGKCIYINVDLDSLKERIKNDKMNIRPMFNKYTVEELYELRKDKYDYFMDIKVDNHNIEKCANDIIKELNL